MPQPPEWTLTMKLESISYSAVEKAVRDVLNEQEWPICEEYDDAGLSPENYVKFASQVLTKLRHHHEGC